MLAFRVRRERVDTEGNREWLWMHRDQTRLFGILWLEASLDALTWRNAAVAQRWADAAGGVVFIVTDDWRDHTHWPSDLPWGVKPGLPSVGEWVDPRFRRSTE